MNASDAMNGRSLGLGGFAAPRRYESSSLLLILAVGGAIVFCDALINGMPVLASKQQESFSYAPGWGSWVFALAMLPLVWNWAWRAGAGKVEVVLLWLALCSGIYTRDFAYIRVPGTPIFITEATLLVLTVATFLWPVLRVPRLNSALMRFVVVFLLLGGVALARGLMGGGEPLRGLRDYAMVAYVVFAVITFQVVRSWDHVVRFGYILIVGAMLLTVNGVGLFLSAPGARRYIGYGPNLTCAITVVAVAFLAKRMRPVLAWIVGSVLLLGLMLANMRSLIVCTAVGILVAMLLSVMARGKHFPIAGLVRAAVAVVVLGVALIVVLANTRAGADFLQRETQDISSGLLNTSADDSVEFRVIAWGEALYRFAQNPLLGEGFGYPFEMKWWGVGDDFRPHNTYLTVLYKMGLTGAAPLLWLLCWFYARALRLCWGQRTHPQIVMLHGIIVSQLMLCVYGFANLLLESPFLACLFWMNLGIGIRAMRLIERGEQTVMTTRAATMGAN